MKAGEIRTIIKGVDTVFDRYPKALVKEECLKAVQNGNWLYPNMLEISAQDVKAEDIRIYGNDGVFYGIYGYQEEKKAFVPKKMFFYKVQ